MERYSKKENKILQCEPRYFIQQSVSKMSPFIHYESGWDLQCFELRKRKNTMEKMH